MWLMFVIAHFYWFRSKQVYSTWLRQYWFWCCFLFSIFFIICIKGNTCNFKKKICLTESLQQYLGFLFILQRYEGENPSAKASFTSWKESKTLIVGNLLLHFSFELLLMGCHGWLIVSVAALPINLLIKLSTFQLAIV